MVIVLVVVEDTWPVKPDVLHELELNARIGCC